MMGTSRRDREGRRKEMGTGAPGVSRPGLLSRGTWRVCLSLVAWCECLRSGAWYVYLLYPCLPCTVLSHTPPKCRSRSAPCFCAAYHVIPTDPPPLSGKLPLQLAAPRPRTWPQPPPGPCHRHLLSRTRSAPAPPRAPGLLLDARLKLEALVVVVGGAVGALSAGRMPWGMLDPNKLGMPRVRRAGARRMMFLLRVMVMTPKIGAPLPLVWGLGFLDLGMRV